MPLITLTKEEQSELTALLEALDVICTAEARYPGQQSVIWRDLQPRIQSLRLQLFQEK